MGDSNFFQRGSNPMNNAPTPSRANFPQSEDEFKDDERVSFDRQQNKFVLEHYDGTEYEWNTNIQRWNLLTDEALLEQQRSAYKMQGVDEHAPVELGKKRKNGDVTAGDKKKAKKEPVERVSTAVYVTGITLDADFDEVNDLFKKYGIIATNIENGQPRIKLYEDDSGSFKGDALITYFRPESVAQAIMLLDGTSFRSIGKGSMHVEKADLSYKKQKEVPTGEQVQKNKKTAKDRQKAIDNINAQNARLADWSDDDTSAIVTKPPSKWDHFVVLKNMFTLEELAEDPAEILEIKEDVRDVCAEYGEVTNLVLYDLEADGVITVRFKEPKAAEICVEKMSTRRFSGRPVKAYVPKTNERFRKSSNRDAGDDDHLAATEEAEAARLAAYGRELEAEGAAPDVQPAGS